jgi:hypothetical protein
MKFAKYDVLGDGRMTDAVLTVVIRELDQDAVPEWRTKYLDYRVHSSPLSSQLRADVWSSSLARRRSKPSPLPLHFIVSMKHSRTHDNIDTRSMTVRST